MNTDSIESETKRVVNRIREKNSAISDLWSDEFLNIFGKRITIVDPVQHSTKVTFFIFCSVIFTGSKNSCTSSESISLKFTLRLPYRVLQMPTDFSTPNTFNIDRTPAYFFLTILDFMLGHCSNEVLLGMNEYYGRQLVVNINNTL